MWRVMFKHLLGSDQSLSNSNNGQTPKDIMDRVMDISRETGIVGRCYRRAQDSVSLPCVEWPGMLLQLHQKYLARQEEIHGIS